MNEEIQQAEIPSAELDETELAAPEIEETPIEETPAVELEPDEDVLADDELQPAEVTLTVGVAAIEETQIIEQEPAEEDEFPSELDLPDDFALPADETGDGEPEGNAASEETSESSEPVAEEQITATREELKPVIESLLFVADEPLPFKQLCKVLGDVPEEDVQAALEELVADHETRSSGLEIREIAGGWRLSTRPQNHEFIRKYLKSRPSARLSLPALETLAVIAYKQPITVPEILEIRGVSSSSAIKTLLEKRLIVTKGRKETVGRPMMYGTSREFLIQFGLKDLNELPSFEDFEDLTQ